MAPWTADRVDPFARFQALSLLPAGDKAEGTIALSELFGLFGPEESFESAMAELRARMGPGEVAPLLEVLRFTPERARREAMYALLAGYRGESLGSDHDGWLRWLWSQPYEPREDYGLFKAVLYADIDPRFFAYFDDHTADATIRLDEVRWGGVGQNGIPPLVEPEMIAADAADYLGDGDVVFGIEVNGDARAYPKRVLAWHEMFKDTVGGEPVNGVYCTLCGSMILYRTRIGGEHHELGTSGFLFRSNKLMFDEATHSLWSTLTGEPVIGPLVGRGLRLEPLSVVTTTWGRWKRQHPRTTVLSLNTGHRRDYGEGAAYRDYFGTDALMFTVPRLDRRLANKAEVLALRFGGDDAPPTVIVADFLAGRPVYRGVLGGVRYVVLTDAAGANRVYAEPDAVTITGFDTDAMTATDHAGRRYRVLEHALVDDGGGDPLPRLSAHRAFWFGWHAAYPDTVLIH